MNDASGSNLPDSAAAEKARLELAKLRSEIGKNRIDRWISVIQSIGLVTIGAAGLLFVTWPQSQWQKESDTAKNKGEALKLLIETAKLPESDHNNSLKNLALEHFREQVELQTRAGYVTSKRAYTFEPSDIYGSANEKYGEGASDCALARINTAKFEARKRELGEALSLEVSGRGPSGKIGFGPTAARIKQDIISIEKLIAQELKTISESCKTESVAPKG